MTSMHPYVYTAAHQNAPRGPGSSGYVIWPGNSHTDSEVRTDTYFFANALEPVGNASGYLPLV